MGKGIKVSVGKPEDGEGLVLRFTGAGFFLNLLVYANGRGGLGVSAALESA